MKVKSLTTFVHGSLSMERGQVMDIPDSVANDLAKAKLVVIHNASPELDNSVPPEPENKAEAEPENKAPAKHQNKGRK